MEYLPIKIKIYKGEKYIYPDLDKIPSSIRKELTWTKYIDVYGLGMQYDRINSLTIRGVSEGYCGTVVPSDFAEAAAALYPDQIKILTEAEWTTFYDVNLHGSEPEEIINHDALLVISIRMQMEKDGTLPAPSQEVLNERIKALDPNDSTVPGVIKNTRKRWADYKTGLTIKIKEI
jgi:hypothetical protein